MIIYGDDSTCLGRACVRRPVSLESRVCVCVARGKKKKVASFVILVKCFKTCRRLRSLVSDRTHTPIEEGRVSQGETDRAATVWIAFGPADSAPGSPNFPAQ